jgi:lipoprotein-releasing system ATP-binding protein
MIEAKNIKKRYADLDVLKGVDLHVKKAEIVSIVGASGAGKSTLLHILGTLDAADEGEIIIDGKKINDFSAKQLSQFRNKNIGFVFQFHHLLPEFTALENVAMPAMISGINKKDAFAKAKKLLAFLDLSAREEHKPNALSGGEQQRVAVARALINDPSVIFADEPSGNLDSLHARELHKLFFRLRDSFQQTFIIVTHNEELASISDYCLHMADGKII